MSSTCTLKIRFTLLQLSPVMGVGGGVVSGVGHPVPPVAGACRSCLLRFPNLSPAYSPDNAFPISTCFTLSIVSSSCESLELRTDGKNQRHNTIKTRPRSLQKSTSRTHKTMLIRRVRGLCLCPPSQKNNGGGVALGASVGDSVPIAMPVEIPFGVPLSVLMSVAVTCCHAPHPRMDVMPLVSIAP